MKRLKETPTLSWTRRIEAVVVPRELCSSEACLNHEEHEGIEGKSCCLGHGTRALPFLMIFMPFMVRSVRLTALPTGGLKCRPIAKLDSQFADTGRFSSATKTMAYSPRAATWGHSQQGVHKNSPSSSLELWTIAATMNERSFI